MRSVPSAQRFGPPDVPGMRRVCFVRFEFGDRSVSATAVGVGHRLPAECSVSVSQGLELAEHYPVVVRRAGVSNGSAA